MESYQEYLKGRGAQINPKNQFLQNEYDTSETDGLDEPLDPERVQTEVFYEHPKKILNKVDSPDVPFSWSLNPYQGCEHGCIYCYARNAHQYWGFSAGLDFERKIIVKENAPEVLYETFMKKNWEPAPVMFSGNTDCYQPLERKLEITRRCLTVFQQFHHPLGLITKNALILRDLDILQELAKENLVHVSLSITTMEESLRRKMEPRTSSAKKRFETVEKLTAAGIPTGVMLGPIIPGLNNHEIPQLLEEAANRGAVAAGYTFVRLNGAIGQIFTNWIETNYPDRAEKVLNQIKASHGGKLSDSRFGKRMSGEGAIAKSVSDLFKLTRKKHFGDRKMPAYNLEAFRRPGDNQLSLF
ncbi:MAG: PA0069 family radical SAM protein [Bacteroidota bacterium]